MPTGKGNIRADQLGIGSVLRLHSLVVPPNQREYAWEDEHVNDLFQDFAGAIDSDTPSYFLGTIVLTNGEESGHPEVSDGQQRLATTTILLAAMRDYFLSEGDDELAASIENDFLFTFDRDSRSKKAKLILNVDDRDFFQKTILARPKDRGQGDWNQKDSHKKIAAAATIAAQHVRDILAPFKQERRADTLNRWLKFVQNRAQVILLQVPDDLDAYVMFETLNGRGLRTSQADLLKNYLFQRSGNKRLIEAQQKWGAMNGALESLGEEDITVTYLRHLLQTQHGPTKEREVLDKVKREINSQPKSLAFLGLLADTAGDYVAMLNPAHPKWQAQGYGDGMRRSIETIKVYLRVEQIRPLMLAVSKYFAPKEAEKAFRLFVSWSVRFLIVGGRGGFLDRHYALRAHEVGSGKIKTAKDLAKAMEDAVPSDTTFEAAFSEARVSQTHLARYYLRALELKETDQPEPELVPNEDRTITLEHVLPENPNGNWPGIDPSDANAYYKRIGNMVLLGASRNSDIGNKSFAEKKATLANSGYLLTKEVGRKSSWGIQQIKDRSKRLAELAARTWPLEVR